MKRYLVFLLFLTIEITLHSNVQAQWTTGTLSQARYYVQGIAVGSKVFFSGGYNNVEPSNVVDIYNSVNGTWSTATLSQARYSLSSASVDGKVFFAGGAKVGGGSNVVDIYDNNTDIWSTATLSQARAELAATSVGHKVFFGGGGDGTPSNVVDIYDNLLNSWTTSLLSQPRIGVSAASVGNKVFFAGGWDGSVYSNVIDIYDNSTNTWSTATLSQARGGSGVSSVGTKVFFAGGYGNEGYSDVVDIYDLSSNTWDTASLSEARSGLGATSTGTKVFFAGGYGTNYSGVVDIYDNITNSWTTSTLSQRRSPVGAASIGNKVFFGGGQYEGYSNSNVVDIFDTSLSVVSFSPQTSGVETQIKITGNNFSTIPDNNIVKFNGTIATLIGTPTEATIVVTVPSGATTGKITVEVGGQTATSSADFIVSSPVPSITSFTPTSGTLGTSITITGTGFNTTPANNVVIFGATNATVTGATATQLTVTVPAGATYAPITVLNASTGLLAYSNNSFTPTFSPSKGIITTSDFSAKVDFTTGTNPYSVAIGDLNGDGKPDLVVANRTSNTVSVFRNTGSAGTISYASRMNFAAGSKPWSVAIGDLDGDGKADLAVVNNGSNTVSVFRNTGSNGIFDFDTKVDFTTGTGPFSVSINDLDYDGRADLAVANYSSSTVSVFRNTGSPGSISYALKVDFATGTFPTSVAIGDIDGDTKADLAITNNNTNNVSVFRNTSSVGTVSFTTKVDFSTGLQPFTVVMGDVDGDSKSDLVITNLGSKTTSIFRNTGSQGAVSFAPKVDLPVSDFPYFVAMGDLDGDGMEDMAVTSYSMKTVSVFRNASASGNITFSSRVDFNAGTGAFSLAMGDLDGDSKTDLAVVNQEGNTISIIRNNPVFLPTISGFSPITGHPGDVVNITGTNFSTEGINSVMFNGSPANIVGTPTSTSISVLVPNGASTGKISIRVGTKETVSNDVFTISVDPNSKWSTGTLSQAREGLGSATVGTKVFFAGGFIGTSGNSNVVDIYDNATSTWSIAALSQARNSLGAASIGNKAFFAGGFITTTSGGTTNSAYSNVVDIYDNTTNSWSVATLSQPRYDPAAASVGTKVFFAGGGTYNFTPSDVVDIYDTSTNTWSTATLSQPRESIRAISVGTKVFFAGGVGDLGDSDVVDIYDNSTSSWTTATLSQARSTFSSVAIGTKVFFAGGLINGSTASNIVDVYDINTAIWTSETLSQARFGLSATSVGTKALFAGGQYKLSISGGTINYAYSNVVDIYDSSDNSWTISILSQPRANLSATSVGSKAFFGGGFYGLNVRSDVVDIYEASTPPPSITSFTAASGAVGTTITISGTNFSTTAANNVVKFNGTAATITGTPTPASLVVTVPSGATTGKITVEVGGQTAISSADFTVLLSQNITFNPLPSKTSGDPSFSLTATSSSGLPVTYTSSDPAVASVSGNTVTILKAGSVTITASQSGDDNFNAAPTVEQVLIIKTNQVLRFDPLSDRYFGDPSFDLSASVDTNLPITFSSSNTNVAEINGRTLIIKGAGTATITATQNGNQNYNSANAQQTLTVKQGNYNSGLAKLIKDINQGQAWPSLFRSMAEVNGKFILSLKDVKYGEELLVTKDLDLPPVLLKDLRQGANGSFPKEFTVVNDKLFFAASDSISEVQSLWRTDGTEAGTVKIRLPFQDGFIRSMNKFNNGLIFRLVRDGKEFLVYSDGTTQGTTILKEVSYNSTGYYPDEMVSMNGKIFLNGYYSGRYSLWVTDGTIDGTKELKAGFSNPEGIFNNYAYIDIDGEQWRSDGTAAGTIKLNYRVDTQSGVILNGKLYYAEKGSNFNSIDANENIITLKSAFELSVLGKLGNRIFLNIKSSSTSDNEIWIFDSAIGSFSYYTKLSIAGVNFKTWIGMSFQNRLFLFTQNQQFNAAIWATNGQIDGTYLINELEKGEYLATKPKEVLNHIAFYTSRYSSGFSYKLRFLDDTPSASEVIFKKVFEGSDPRDFMRYKNDVFFNAFNEKYESWKTSGTEPTTVKEQDLANFQIQYQTVLNDQIIFLRQGALGKELWKYNYQDGASLVKKTNDGTVYYSDNKFIKFQNKLAFWDYTSSYQDQLWISDGTEGGTQKIIDIIAPIFESVLVTENAFYFVTTTMNYNGNRILVKSDGSALGTITLAEFPELGKRDANSLVKLGNEIFFIVSENDRDRGLWKVNIDTDAVTVVKEFNPGQYIGEATVLFAANGKLYISINDDTTGTELWVSDGTAEGTTILKDINPGSAGSNLWNFTTFGDRVFFTANDGIRGQELWSTRGTTETTNLVADLTPGLGNAWQGPFNLFVTHNRLLFWTPANELWEILPGSQVPSKVNLGVDFDMQYGPREFFEYDDLILFSGNTPELGNELWALDYRGANNHTITFAVDNKKFGDPDFTLSATSSSGEPVTFKSTDSSVIEVVGNVAKIKSGGKVKLIASEIGDSKTKPAIAEVFVEVAKIDQAITFNAITPVSYSGQSFRLEATSDSGLPVSYESSNQNVASISGKIITIKGAGTSTITARQVGNESFNASSQIQQVLTVAKGVPSILWDKPLDIVYGTTLSASQLNGTSSIEGTFSYTPAIGAKLNAGSNQNLLVTFTPANSANYTSTTKQVTINVSKATPSISWSSPSDIIYGTTLSPTQLNATSSVDGTFSYTPSNGTKLNAGSNQNLSVTFTPTDAANYNSATKQVTINVSKATPSISWSSPADIIYGTTLSAIQLNATSSVDGTFSYTPVSSTKLNAGSNQNLSVLFTPSDAANYEPATKQVIINVSKAIPSVGWSNPSDIVYGTALSAAQLNATSSVEGTFSYTPAIGTKLNAGSNQNLSVTFTPADAANHTSATKQVTINVSKATPSLIWSNPADVVYGTTLSATQLNASSSVDGTFSYSPVGGTKLSAGSNQNLSVTFTPADAANYTSATKQVTINVSKATPSLIWSNPADIIYGTALSATQLNATSLVDGTFSYTPISGTKLNAGSNQNLSVTFTPADAANYTSATKQVTINVSKATPSITWSNPSDIVYGSALSSTQLNATSSVTGTFIYAPAVNTKLNAGNAQQLSVTLSPTDDINYLTTTAKVSINVSKAQQQITFGALPDKTIGDGSFSLTATMNSTLPVSYSTTSDKVGIANGIVSLLKPGRVDITANQSGNENYNAAASVSQSFCIKPLKPIITLSGLNTATPTLASSATTGNQWYSGTTLLTGETNNTLVIKTSGTYKVQVKADDCLSEFSLDQNLIITGDVSTTSEPLLVYPNPATSILTINLGNEDGKKEVAIFDLLGRSILTQQNEGKKTEIDVTEYARGLYIIKVQTVLREVILRFEKQ
jgi:ELWxxDGT repeat protein